MRSYDPLLSLRTRRSYRTEGSLWTNLALRPWRTRRANWPDGSLRSWRSLRGFRGELLSIEMPAALGILNELSAVRVRSRRNEERRVLIHGRMIATHRDQAENERIVGSGRCIRRIEANAHGLEDERRCSVETERLSIRVLCRDHDAEVTVVVWERKCRGGIEREANAVRRERDTWIHVHGIRDGDSQTPTDVTKTDGPPEVEHSISQSILEMGEMLGCDSQAIEKLRMGIGSHRSVLRCPNESRSPQRRAR